MSLAITRAPGVADGSLSADKFLASLAGQLGVTTTATTRRYQGTILTENFTNSTTIFNRITSGYAGTWTFTPPSANYSTTPAYVLWHCAYQLRSNSAGTQVNGGPVFQNTAGVWYRGSEVIGHSINHATTSSTYRDYVCGGIVPIALNSGTGSVGMNFAAWTNSGTVACYYRNVYMHQILVYQS